jgi:hypothetical protein
LPLELRQPRGRLFDEFLQPAAGQLAARTTEYRSRTLVRCANDAVGSENQIGFRKEMENCLDGLHSGN